MLIILKMMARMGRLSDDPDSVERHHVMLEIARLAYAMRDVFVADPELADVPVEHMLDDSVIAELVGTAILLLLGNGRALLLLALELNLDFLKLNLFLLLVRLRILGSSLQSLCVFNL